MKTVVKNEKKDKKKSFYYHILTNKSTLKIFNWVFYNQLSLFFLIT